MKEAKFTPGPLTIAYTPRGKQYTYPNHWEIEKGGITLGAAKSKSDALLWKTAPDLLEALETVLTDMLELHQDEIDADHYGDDGCEYCEHIADVRAAIAKALGED